MTDPTLPRESDPVEAALDALSMKAAVERGGTRDAAMQAIGIDLAVHEIRAAIRSRPVEEGERRARLREAVGTGGGDEGLPHFHVADGKAGVYVERQAVLDLIDEVLG